MRNVALALAALSVLLTQPTAALAQDSAITGQVLDTSGQALPGVTVEVTNPELPVPPPITVTDGQGRYTISDLPSGTYTVIFRLPGFGTTVQDDVLVTAGATVRLDKPMTVGEIGARVTVSIDLPAGLPLLDQPPPFSAPTTSPGAGILLNCVVNPSGTVGGCRRSVVTPSIYR